MVSISPRLASNSKPLPHSNNVTSVYTAGLKFAIKHFLYAWLTSRRRAIKAQRGHTARAAVPSAGLFPASYQIHVLCPNIRIWLWPPVDFVFVCKENLSGDLVEGFFSSGVKERLRLLVQTAIRKGCGLQECGRWARFLRIVYGIGLQSDITVVLENTGARRYRLTRCLNPQVSGRWGCIHARMHIYHGIIRSKFKQKCQDKKKKKQFPLAVFASQHFINRVRPPSLLLQ